LGTGAEASSLTFLWKAATETVELQSLKTTMICSFVLNSKGERFQSDGKRVVSEARLLVRVGSEGE
jgi:hypothetical protein